MRPFTLAPTVRWPTSVCTAYAKSIGVAPAGSVFTSPFGVKTNTSSSKRSVRKLFTNSRASSSSSLMSISWRTHSFHSSSACLERRPVRSDAELGGLLHLARAHLDLQRPALGPDHGRVEAAVAVELRHGDVVLEAAGHRLPEGVDKAERAVAVARPLLARALDDHAHGREVVDLVELAALA